MAEPYDTMFESTVTRDLLNQSIFQPIPKTIVKDMTTPTPTPTKPIPPYGSPEDLQDTEDSLEEDGDEIDFEEMEEQIED